ncbi:pseudouridylate synthase [Vairimorpha apis BRL 01]|uniref:tRNA pseudouridine(55) synthase n=1 Tax=Vairimorpha apis BRL 01 TaxID=1037528 RepID=T0MFP3_9MICR|nr:pseudouridylate synthase [Vairimorpha apis BRL 01]
MFIITKSSAGAYIKEFVNGDFGRTVPCLNGVVCELDVVCICKGDGKTPLRVVHRRPNITRYKRIRIIKYEYVYYNKMYWYEILLEASAGAYIKEFVNGDFGRTVPCLNGVVCELDVVCICKGDGVCGDEIKLIKEYF